LIAVEPVTNFVPVSVTFTELPAGLPLGLIDVSVGVTDVIVKTTALLVPAEVVTVRFTGPEAVGSMSSSAVI